MRVARQQQLGQPVVEPGQPLLQFGGFHREGRVLVGQLTRGCEVVLGRRQLADGLGHRAQLRVATGQLARERLVGVHGRVGQLALQVRVLGQQRRQHVSRIAHGNLLQS